MSRLMDNEYPIAEVLGPMPHGDMDEEGYLTLDSKPIQLAKAPLELFEPEALEPNAMCIQAADGIVWNACGHIVFPSESASEWQLQAFAVLLGCFSGYSPTMTPAYDCNNV